MYPTIKNKFPHIRANEFRSVYYSGREKSSGLWVTGAYHGILTSIAESSLKIAVKDNGETRVFKIRLSAIVDII